MYIIVYGYNSWTIKKAEHWRIDAFKLWCWKRLLSKEIKPVNLKENQPWIFIGRTDAEAEAPVLWPPDVKNWLTGEDPDSGKDWGQEEKGGNRGWDGWKASSIQWTWVWANFRRQWRTRKPDVLQSMGLPSRTWLSDWTTTKNLKCESRSVVSDSLQPHGLYSPWNSPGQNTGVCSFSLIFPTQGLNLGLLHCR